MQWQHYPRCVPDAVRTELDRRMPPEVRFFLMSGIPWEYVFSLEKDGTYRPRLEARPGTMEVLLSDGSFSTEDGLGVANASYAIYTHWTAIDSNLLAGPLTMQAAFAPCVDWEIVLALLDKLYAVRASTFAQFVANGLGVPVNRGPLLLPPRGGDSAEDYFAERNVDADARLKSFLNRVAIGSQYGHLVAAHLLQLLSNWRGGPPAHAEFPLGVSRRVNLLELTDAAQGCLVGLTPYELEQLIDFDRGLFDDEPSHSA